MVKHVWSTRRAKKISEVRDSWMDRKIYSGGRSEDMRDTGAGRQNRKSASWMQSGKLIAENMEGM